MRETSLDDFTGGADEDDEGEPEARNGVEEPVVEEPDADESSAAESEADGSALDEPYERDEPEGDDLDPESDPVEPAVSTYDWTPTGADCQACGTTVEPRWRDDGRLVCADCKVW